MSDAKKKLEIDYAKKELAFKQDAEKLLGDLGFLPKTSNPPGVQATNHVGLRKKILVVEDSIEIREFISDILKTKDVNVIEASDGEQALTRISQNPDIALVFLDLVMPKIDGIAFLKMIRKLDVIPHAPIIVTSGNTSPKMIKDLKSLNISGFLVKPISKDKILNSVEKISQKPLRAV